MPLQCVTAVLWELEEHVMPDHLVARGAEPSCMCGGLERALRTHARTHRLVQRRPDAFRFGSRYQVGGQLG
jgi:hypothetical protein